MGGLRATNIASPLLVTVPEAGKPVQLEPNASGEAFSVLVEALSTNEGAIVVGDKNVKAAPGTHAAPTQRGTRLLKGETVSFDLVDLSQIWADTTINGDGITLVVLQ